MVGGEEDVWAAPGFQRRGMGPGPRRWRRIRVLGWSQGCGCRGTRDGWELGCLPEGCEGGAGQGVVPAAALAASLE